MAQERDRLDWSQDELAKRLTASGVPCYASTIAKIESGKRAIKLDEASAMADLFGLSLDSLLGRTGMEDDQAHALTVLADQAEKTLPDLMGTRETLRRAYQELELQFDFLAFDRQVATTEAWSFDGLSLEHQRALLMWGARDLAMYQLTEIIACLTEVVAVRSMTPVDIAERVKRLEAIATKRKAGTR